MISRFCCCACQVKRGRRLSWSALKNELEASIVPVKHPLSERARGDKVDAEFPASWQHVGWDLAPAASKHCLNRGDLSLPDQFLDGAGNVPDGLASISAVACRRHPRQRHDRGRRAPTRGTSGDAPGEHAASTSGYGFVACSPSLVSKCR